MHNINYIREHPIEFDNAMKLRGEIPCSKIILKLDKDKNNPLFKNKVFFIKGDIRNFNLDDIKIDYCFHMATTNAHETFNNEDQLNKIDLLYNGTKNLMQQLIKADIKKIIFTSSGVVYGPLGSQEEF